MEYKKCSKCEVLKSTDDFFKKGNRNTSYCKICLTQYQHQRWIELKRRAVKLMGGKCQKCGYNRCLSALEFHHLDPTKKDVDFSHVRRRAWKTVVEELKKCLLLCSNCHREEHANEGQFIVLPIEDKSILNMVSSDLSEPLPAKSILNKSPILPTGNCRICGVEVFGTIFCSPYCSAASRRKVNRPSKDQLKADIAAMSWLAIGRKYNVSDNAIRKWAKQDGLLA